ncbi:MAG: hypothetical protein NC415_11210 [bacterium]|nr:hypothetical protein [bacterium]
MWKKKIPDVIHKNRKSKKAVEEEALQMKESKDREGIPKKKNDILKIVVITILIIIAMVAVVIAIFSSPFAFLIYLVAFDGDGKLDNAEKISEVVIENQETLQEIVSQVLSPEYDLDFVLDIEERELQSLGSSRDVDEESFDLEEVCRLLEELEIKKIMVYKDSDVDIVLFETYTSGIVSSSEEMGCFYLAGGVPEKLLEYNLFTIYRTYDYSEITDHWYYYDIIY